MRELTITEVTKYTGFTRQTVMKWLSDGTIQGRKTDGNTAVWIIPSDEVLRVANEKINYYQSLADNIKNRIIDMPGYKDANS